MRLVRATVDCTAADIANQIRPMYYVYALHLPYIMLVFCFKFGCLCGVL